ncbi:hypothetical protein [Streptomyces chartreusis]|uniref:hypothetical protein n=1 Tax=Streptomyces chartreusis TaxID=1969 RepID=UPI0035D881B7
MRMFNAFRALAAAVAAVGLSQGSWPLWVVLGLTGGAVMIYHLGAERSRRKTLVAIFRTAPADSIVVQGRGPGCPEVWIKIGAGARPDPSSLAQAAPGLGRTSTGGEG